MHALSGIISDGKSNNVLTVQFQANELAHFDLTHFHRLGGATASFLVKGTLVTVAWVNKGQKRARSRLLSISPMPRQASSPAGSLLPYVHMKKGSRGSTASNDFLMTTPRP